MLLATPDGKGYYPARLDDTIVRMVGCRLGNNNVYRRCEECSTVCELYKKHLSIKGDRYDYNGDRTYFIGIGDVVECDMTKNARIERMTS